MTNTIAIDRKALRALTKSHLKLRVLEFKKDHPQCGSFILSDVLGTKWTDEFLPFYQLYSENNAVAGQEMGKLLATVCKELKLKSLKEARFGKDNAITRYYF